MSERPGAHVFGLFGRHRMRHTPSPRSRRLSSPYSLHSPLLRRRIPRAHAAGRRHRGARLGGAQLYFCQPRHPWQEGTNENTDGLVREFFPLGTDLSKASREEAQRAFGVNGDRPRRVLGFRVANEVYREETLHSA